MSYLAMKLQHTKGEPWSIFRPAHLRPEVAPDGVDFILVDHAWVESTWHFLPHGKFMLQLTNAIWI